MRFSKREPSISVALLLGGGGPGWPLNASSMF